MEEQPEVIGPEGAAGGAVRMQEGLVVLDEAFHGATGAVDSFVDEGGP